MPVEPLAFLGVEDSSVLRKTDPLIFIPAEMHRIGIIAVALVSLAALSLAKKAEQRPEWAKKDPIHYTDADVERLLEQWDEDEEIDEDDVPEHKRPPPKMDLNQFDPTKPEDFLKASKKGLFTIPTDDCSCAARECALL